MTHQSHLETKSPSKWPSTRSCQTLSSDANMICHQNNNDPLRCKYVRGDKFSFQGSNISCAADTNLKPHLWWDLMKLLLWALRRKLFCFRTKKVPPEVLLKRAGFLGHLTKLCFTQNHLLRLAHLHHVTQTCGHSGKHCCCQVLCAFFQKGSTGLTTLMQKFWPKMI